MTLAEAIKVYNKTFNQKTSKAKGYSALDMSADEDEIVVTSADMEPSTLDPAVQRLITFIHDKKAIEQTVIKAGYDVKKMPLGKLSESTIKEGYKYLSQIEDLLKSVGRNDESCAPLSDENKDKVFALSG